jgi:betaine-aldehyde dehydrogenase
VFNLVTGYGGVVGEALAGHREVDMISFTGSTRAGKRVSELAAQSVKRVALELGGKSASILLEDADFAAAAKGTVSSCFLNSGQTCAAHTRMLVPESKYDEAVRLVLAEVSKYTVGDPFSETSKLGPLVSRTQRERVRGYIKKGIEEGAELLCGGPDTPPALPTGWYVKPTVFGRVHPDSTLAQEEIFGPVLSIIVYKDEEDAVAIANDSMYGLSGGVWSKDEARAIRVARRIRTGQVDINGAPFNLQAPFGGYKQSGHGREYGRRGLEEFLEYKSIQFKPERKA